MLLKYWLHELINHNSHDLNLIVIEVLTVCFACNIHTEELLKFLEGIVNRLLDLGRHAFYHPCLEGVAYQNL